MKNTKINDYFNLKYDEIIEALKQKYGKVNGDYFCTKERKSINNKIKRTKEGLFIHHVYEKHYQNLGEKEIAKKYPWEFQEAKNLVYCDLFEHVLLHIKIWNEYGLFGVGVGMINRQLRDFLFNWNPAKRIEEYFFNVRKYYVDRIDEYYDLMEYYMKNVKDTIEFSIAYDKHISIRYKDLRLLIGDIENPLFFERDIERLMKIYFNNICYINTYNKSPISSFNKLKEITFKMKQYHENKRDDVNCFSKNRGEDCSVIYDLLYKELSWLEKYFTREKFETRFIEGTIQLMYLMLYKYTNEYEHIDTIYYPHELFENILVVEEYLKQKKTIKKFFRCKDCKKATNKHKISNYCNECLKNYFVCNNCWDVSKRGCCE